VVKKLVELTHLDKRIKVIVCPTLREEDGLAMSSRNLRLNEQEREKAKTIFKVLSYIKSTINLYNIEQVKKTAVTMLEENGFKVDYVSIADAKNLEEIKN